MTNYNKISTRASRDADLEAELAELEKVEVQPTPVTEAVVVEPVEGAVNEEDGWKKRYGDLRRHADAEKKRLADEKAALIKQLESATKQQLKFPDSASIEDVVAWAEEFPKVAGILETFAQHKIDENTKDLKREVEAIKQERLNLAKERAVTQVLKKHPDFLELIDTADFKDWVVNQPIVRGPIIGQALYDALYENDTDHESAIEAVDQYKADKKLKRNPPRKNENERAAASTVPTQSQSTPVSNGSNKRTFLESEVENMNIHQYERLESEIEEARRDGRFVYDISAGAR